MCSSYFILMIVEIILAIFFGIVEGITEWLPISSTGHLILIKEFFSLSVSKEFFSIFLVMIQLGAILAVVKLYWSKIIPIKKISKTNGESGKIIVDNRKIVLWYKVFIGCIPAAIFGILLDDFSEKYFYNFFSVAVALIVFGILFFIAEKKNTKPIEINDTSEIPIKNVIIIGLFQIIAAIFPGTSRSGATITGGLLSGIPRVVAADFTFIMAIPVMFGASLLKIVKHGLNHSIDEWIILLIGMVTAYYVSIIVIKKLLVYLKNNTMNIFAIYRIILGIVLIIYGVFK